MTLAIVDYRETWPDEFRSIGSALRAALGALAVRIDHIGSTSVPGLPSKDIIDVQVTVQSFERFDPIEECLAAIGYTLREHVVSDHRPDDHHSATVTAYDPEWEKRYFRPPPAQRPTHLHVRGVGRANQRYALLFRDYLRTHADAANAYAKIKKRLAHYLDNDRIAYTEIKDPVCDLIMQRAESWARQSHWQPGPSDA